MTLPKQQLPVKRWSFLDTINLCLMIVVCLFIIDFKHNALLSWVVILAFAVWLVTVIVRNIYLSKNKSQR